jgi:hypothetical protein
MKNREDVKEIDELLVKFDFELSKDFGEWIPGTQWGTSEDGWRFATPQKKRRRLARMRGSF